MAEIDKRVDGLREGIARGVSQACVFFIEASKSAQQVGGNALQWKKDPVRLLCTMAESAISSGVVFGAYFTTYNHIGMANPLAGPVASLVTSFIKIPIGNAMRCVHVGLAPGLVSGTKRIVKLQGVRRGLYSGYGLSLIEDMIEFDLRTRLYVYMKEYAPADVRDHVACGIGFGAIAGMLASFVTTPFDTVRANMILCQKRASDAVLDLGIAGLYRGAGHRLVSNGVKYALFFMTFELLQQQSARHSHA
jgi:hypothetical protein